MPFSAQDVCFNAQSNGCGGGTLFTPWSFIKSDGVVSGGQYLQDTADPPSDPFDGEGFCASFSLPHCHHHGDQGADPYPAEGDAGCPSVAVSPRGPTGAAAATGPRLLAAALRSAAQPEGARAREAAGSTVEPGSAGMRKAHGRREGARAVRRTGSGAPASCRACSN